VGCGRIADKPALLRIALAPAGERGQARTAVADERAVLPGRGAYVCREPSSGAPQPSCLAQASRRGVLARALRARVTLDPKLVESREGGAGGRDLAAGPLEDLDIT
jgi:predicted RNA-binding protein YlxR (DUF448 family)